MRRSASPPAHAAAYGSPSAAPTGLSCAAAAPGRLPAVPPQEYDSAPLNRDRRIAAGQRASLRRAAWWRFPLIVLLTLAIVLSGFYMDQRLTGLIFWPAQGATFRVLNPQAATDAPDRTRMVIVAGGLGTKSGTRIAQALAPSLVDDNTRLVTLVYGNGIYEPDIDSKFEQLFHRYKPRELVFFGSSMGGDVLLRLARYVTANADKLGQASDAEPPMVTAIYLDCTPLGADDVRDAKRTKADLITAISEATGTYGGGFTRILAEMLATRSQWLQGTFPDVYINGTAFTGKLAEIMRDKVRVDGVSTELVADQYGAIRRFHAEDVLSGLYPGTRIVFFMPTHPTDDRTVNDAQVAAKLQSLAERLPLQLRVFDIDHGSHAAATRLPKQYNADIEQFRRSIRPQPPRACAGGDAMAAGPAVRC